VHEPDIDPRSREVKTTAAAEAGSPVGGANEGQLRVAIAHEWLVRFAGSERCVAEMLETFPGARLLTTIVDRTAVPLPLRTAEPSFLQAIPGATRHHEWLLPLMPLSWQLRRPVRDVDVLVSSSHACAKAVRIGHGIPHLCYCHTPMRYAWDFEAERDRFPRALRPLARASMAWFRRWDRSTATRVTRFVANSSAVAQRIRVAYGRSARVIHPPVGTDFFTPAGERDDFFLYVGRLVSYKRADLVVEAFAGLPEHRLVIVGEGPLGAALEARATSNISFRGSLEDEELRDLYRAARAFVYPADEDFGISMAEAQACGTPVIGLAAGGALDIVDPGRTGWLVEDQSVDALRAAIRRAAQEDLSSDVIAREAARFSPARFRREIDEAVRECAALR
jgi:glycosyltransferase involved in cell wall biosynthesis